MALWPPSSSSCLDLTISTPAAAAFLSSSSSSGHRSSHPNSSTGEGRSLANNNTTMKLLDINQVPTEQNEELLMMSTTTTSINEVDDEDQNNNNGAAFRAAGDGTGDGPARKKLRLSKEQSRVLEETFRVNNTLNPKQKEVLAMQLKLKPRQVEVWFQNRRARSKLKQTEVEYEYLKRYFGSLTEQNRRLQKEVEELRSLRVGQQAALPNNNEQLQGTASTLTMCPRCERVSTHSASSLADKGPTWMPPPPDNAPAANLSLKPSSSFHQPRQPSAAC